MSEPQWQTCPKCGERWWDSHVCRNTLNSLTVALAPTCRFCGQAARAQPAQAEVVPPTHVLVPVEPTEEMLLSARDWSAAKYGKPIGDEAAKGCWGAMIGAAIAQQKGGV